MSTLASGVDAQRPSAVRRIWRRYRCPNWPAPGSGAQTYLVAMLGGVFVVYVAAMPAPLVVAVAVGAVSVLWRRPGRVPYGHCSCDACFVRVTSSRVDGPARSAGEELSMVVIAGCGDRTRHEDGAVTLALREPRVRWRGVVNPAPEARPSRWGRRCLGYGRREQLMLEYVMGPGSVRYVTLGAHHAALLGQTAAWRHFEAVLLPPASPTALALAATLADSLGLVGAYQTAVRANGTHDEAATGLPAAAVVFGNVLVIR